MPELTGGSSVPAAAPQSRVPRLRRLGGGWWRGAASRAWPLALALGLALFLVRSVFLPGYVLLLDFPTGPVLPPLHVGDVTLLNLLVAGLHAVVGGSLMGKVLLVGTLVVAGLAPMVATHWAPWYARVAAGAVGMLNPWVYDRVASGQIGVVIAGSGLMFWIAAFEWLLRGPGWRRALVCGLTATALLSVDPHVAGPLAVLTVLGFLFHRSWRESGQWQGQLLAAAPPAAYLALEGARFLLARGSGAYGSYAYVARFNDFEAFRTVSNSAATLVQRAAGLYGFWGERLGRFPPADGGTSLWIVGALLLAALAVTGGLLTRGRRWILAAGLIGLAATVSTGFPAGLTAATWLAEHLPLIRAYREPAKWDALWLAAVCILPAALAARFPLRRPWRRVGSLAVAVAMLAAALVPVGVVVPQALPAAAAPVVYPAGWEEAAAYLRAHVPPGAPIVVLPWHQYLRLPFSGRVTVNPAQMVFAANLVMPDDPEITGDRALDLADPIGAAALAPTSDCDLADTLRRARIRWALVLQVVDGPATATRLMGCGFHAVEDTGSIAVLSG